jgi:hypothetical protein
LRPFGEWGRDAGTGRLTETPILANEVRDGLSDLISMAWRVRTGEKRTLSATRRSIRPRQGSNILGNSVIIPVFLLSFRSNTASLFRRAEEKAVGKS